MTSSADTFGDWRAAGSPGILPRAARAADRLSARLVALVVCLLLALSGYALWDQFRVYDADDGMNRPTDAESFAALRAINPDAVAWLDVRGTNIDYPVVQGKDDFEYLSTDARGEYSASGSIFLDSKCDPAFHEPWEVVMGHHMEYHKMFGDLDRFLDEGFFRENGDAVLLLPDRTLTLRAVCVLQADAYDQQVFGTPVTDASAMPEIVEHVRSAAIHQREGEWSASDQLIALSTCASSGATARTVVVCKVVGEEAGVHDPGW